LISIFIDFGNVFDVDKLRNNLKITSFHVLATGDSRLGYHVHQISGVKWQSGTWKISRDFLVSNREANDFSTSVRSSQGGPVWIMHNNERNNHVKDISKVNYNGNQYKQKLILWYWTKTYYLMGFTASKIYFYFGTISMFWNLKATISHEFQYLNYLAIGDSRLFWNWLSLTADVGNWEQQWHEFLFLVYPVISWAINV
jgi:hypothetical protein